MRQTQVLVLVLGLAFLGLFNASARADCTLPHQLTNGQVADATQVMANYDALVNCLSSQASNGSANAIQLSNGSGGFQSVGPLADGQVVVGATGAAPQAATLSAGPGISIANGPGSVTISTVASGAGIVTDYGTFVGTAASTSGFAFKGVPIYPLNSATILGCNGLFAPVSGATYEAYLVQFDPATGVVSNVIASSGNVTLSGTSEGYYSFTFTSSASISAGNKYAILIGRTDAAGTYAFPIRSKSSGTTDLALVQSYNSFSFARISGAVRFSGTSISVGSTLDISTVGANAYGFSIGITGAPGP
jgi:hypothetical protein